MFASLQTLGRPNGMGPHGLMGLGRLGATDWQAATCTDASGSSVACEYSQSISQAWNSAQCEPDPSTAAGVCTDASGDAVPNVPAITAVNSLASGAIPAPAGHPITTVLVSGTGAQANPLSSAATPVGGTQKITLCPQTLMSGICDSTLYIGLAVFGIILVVATKR